jgi:small subunit ribosomal protein S30e
MGGAQKKGQKSRAGKGSHGSTTKAGKVRQQTPKIPKSNLRKKKIPRINARRKYHRVVELERKQGQDWEFLESKRK